MTPKERRAFVRSIYPDAYCWIASDDDGRFLFHAIRPEKASDRPDVGQGSTREIAWKDAYRRITSNDPSPAAEVPPIQVWRWADAPVEYRRQYKCDGDTWVIFVPMPYNLANIEWLTPMKDETIREHVPVGGGSVFYRRITP